MRGEKRKDRAEEKLKKFLRAYSEPSPAQRKQYERLTGRKAPKPLTKKERERWVKKVFAQITGRGLHEPEMITITSLREEWFPKAKHDQQKRAWEKALETIEQNKDAALQAAIDSYQKKCRKDNESLSLR